MPNNFRAAARQVSALLLLTFFLFTGETSAQEPTITYGVNNVIELVQDQANQRVDFFISDVANRDFDTFDFLLIIGDGGEIIGGSDTGPILTDVELGEPGTIFDDGNQGTVAGNQTDLLWGDTIDEFAGQRDGFAGTLVFDSTGVPLGTTLDIMFRGIDIDGEIFNSQFLDTGAIDNEPVPVSFASNGSVTIVAVPEPASTAVVLAIAGFLSIRRRR